MTTTTETINISYLLPSQLVRLALNDMRACEQDPRYGFYMGKWHAPRENIPYRVYHDYYPTAECFVCVAGAVMAQTKKVPLNEWKTVNAFPAREEKALAAIDYLRDGWISTALLILGYHDHYPGLPDQFPVTNYITYDPGMSIEVNHQFYGDMLSLAELLEKHGL